MAPDKEVMKEELYQKHVSLPTHSEGTEVVRTAADNLLEAVEIADSMGYSLTHELLKIHLKKSQDTAEK